MKTSLKAVLATVVVALLSVVGQQAEAQVRYLSKSGVKEVPAAEAHYFEVREENAVGGGTLTRYHAADSSKVSLYTYSDLDGGEFKTGVRKGPYYEWYKDGNLRVHGNYSDNKLNGEYKAWHENGQLSYKIHYKNSLPQDTLTAYFESGELRRIEVYKEGEMASGKVYNELGEEIAFFPMMQMPMFPGGEQAMLKWLSTNIKYPKSMRNAKVRGLVVMAFVVEKDGSFSDIEIVKSLHPDGDAEALRVLHTMPAWQPGLEEGKPVNVYFFLPIRYSIW